jgi:hypothetical protein
MKDDERKLLAKVRAWHGNRDRPFVTDLGLLLGIPAKRTEYILGKWVDKGWLECGVSARTGRLTVKGLGAADTLTEAR